MAATLRETDLLAAWADRAAELASRSPRIDAFEITVDEKQDRVLSLHDRRPMNSSRSFGGGLGIQVYVGHASAYAHTAQLDERRVRDALERAADLAEANGRRRWRHSAPAFGPARKIVRAPDARMLPSATSNEDILALLARADAGARERAPTARVSAAFGALERRLVYLDSAGTWMEKASLVSSLRVNVVLRDGARMGEGMARAAGERGILDYEGAGGPEAVGAEAVSRADEALRAVGFPGGRYRVLCDNHLSGMLAHESFGHLTEHDLVSSGWSTLANRLGEKLAVDGVSISDAPVAPHDPAQGVVVPYDDQGVPGQKVTMLDQGVLRGWMHTRDSAASESVEPTGNGRALDARFPSIVRMRNTYFEPGDASLDEALEALDDGIYLVGARGGAPYSDGSFMFTSIRGYRVRGGRIEEPVRSTSIHGNVLDFLQNVELLTRDFDVYTNYFGGCGKRDQSFLHVGVGGPHVLVADALLGGQGQ